MFWSIETRTIVLYRRFEVSTDNKMSPLSVIPYFDTSYLGNLLREVVSCDPDRAYQIVASFPSLNESVCITTHYRGDQDVEVSWVGDGSSVKIPVSIDFLTSKRDLMFNDVGLLVRIQIINFCLENDWINDGEYREFFDDVERNLEVHLGWAKKKFDDHRRYLRLAKELRMK